MDGTGCWRDNVFVERLWKSITYEEVYLHAYETVSAAQQGLERYLTFYNRQRPHRALDGKTPDQVYCDNLTTRLTAASLVNREAPLKEWNILSKQLGPPLSASAASTALRKAKSLVRRSITRALNGISCLSSSMARSPYEQDIPCHGINV